MNFTLTINLGNDAMQNYRDISIALGKLAQGIDNGTTDIDAGDGESIRDENGNTVGSWRVEE